MPAPTPTARPATAQPRERISSVFWNLARGSGAETQSREPEDVVRHLIACLGALDGSRATAGSRGATEISADALNFLQHLEHNPYYASPEQTRGGEKDSQSLVYSIGVLLFERLTGHHPFVESLSPLLCASARDRSSRIGRNNLCTIPSELRAILTRAMAPFPEDRWQGAAALRAAMESFLGRADTALAWCADTEIDVREPPAILAEGSGSAPTPLRVDGDRRARRHARGTEPPPCPGSPVRSIFEARRVEDLLPRPATAFPDDPEVLEPRSWWLRWSTLPLPWRTLRTWRTGAALAAVAVFTAVIILVARGGSTDADAGDRARPIATPIENAAPPAPPEIPSAIVIVPVPASIDFDPEIGGEAAAEAARECLSEARLRGGIQIGLSLRFGASDGLSDRVYFGSGLTAAERRCLEDALIGLTSGAAPERSRIVTYSLWLSSTATKHRVHAIE
ncbi:MAG TPA: hypothetical protein VML75_19940 [Kofleriaceae bacterium]|nr:hypothetical protein [Kofleriaceae bacterium]